MKKIKLLKKLLWLKIFFLIIFIKMTINIIKEIKDKSNNN